MELHIPDGINYECSGCGKCCSGWAVPMTKEDYERISVKDWGAVNEKYKDKKLFRKLKDSQRAGGLYTHTIVRGDDGGCPFLENNLCFIHKSFGGKFKPTICQLFPYCFNETPSGIYTTVSFYSMSVIYNSGRALTAQKEVLEQKWQEFQTINPDHHPNWSLLQLTVGEPITWDEYLKHDEKLLELLQTHKLSIYERLLAGSEYLVSLRKVPPQPIALSNQAALNHLDKHLLVALHKIYFPVKPLGLADPDFSIGRFLYQLAFQGTSLAFPGCSYSIEELNKMPWPSNDLEIQDLLYRYFYSRIFAKLYFGAGFGQLSLITGFHHLCLIAALIKLQSKAWALARQAPTVSLMDVATTVRQLEKGLGETRLGGYSAAVWELLMSSPQRVKRVLACT
ncbi:MAG: YkgJ family cysteine cluster protein [Candidatus Melainabacteria bacterium]|nr:YkgJ family cysteine cluster protein [Candidatus Melainabacteria bacterium]